MIEHLHIFADEMTPPVGFTALIAGLLFILMAVDKVLSIKGRLTKLPPLDTQLVSLRTTLMEQNAASKAELLAALAQQDREAQVRNAQLRDHIDSEIARLHKRQDAHGEELFRLKGYVQGRESLQ